MRTVTYHFLDDQQLPVLGLHLAWDLVAIAEVGRLGVDLPPPPPVLPERSRKG